MTASDDKPISRSGGNVVWKAAEIIGDAEAEIVFPASTSKATFAAEVSLRLEVARVT